MPKKTIFAALKTFTSAALHPCQSLIKALPKPYQRRIKGISEVWQRYTTFPPHPYQRHGIGMDSAWEVQEGEHKSPVLAIILKILKSCQF